MRTLLFILIVSVFGISCKKEKIKAGELVEFYLLKTFKAVPGKCQVDASASALQDEPTIRNQDILEYSQSKYQFTLTETAFQKAKAFGDNMPFAVTVDRQVIYYGFFKPGFSSSSCLNSITMDLDWISGNKIYLKLGYPGVLDGGTIDDQRNNPKLLAALKKQGKLR